MKNLHFLSLLFTCMLNKGRVIIAYPYPYANHHRLLTSVTTQTSLIRALANDATVTFGSDISLTTGTTGVTIDGLTSLIIDGAGYAVDGLNERRCFQVEGITVATIKQLTIKNGYADDGNEDPTSGGGLFIYSQKETTVTLTTVTIKSCTAFFGGAVYVYSANVILQGCTLTENYGGQGGALFISESGYGTLSSTVVSSNVAQYTSGHDDETAGEGGGVYVYSSGTLTLVDYSFSTNNADAGGASGNDIFLSGQYATLNVLSACPPGSHAAYSSDTLVCDGDSGCTPEQSSMSAYPAVVYSTCIDCDTATPYSCCGIIDASECDEEQPTFCQYPSSFDVSVCVPMPSQRPTGMPISEPSAGPVAKPTEGPTKVAITSEPSADPVAKPTEGPTKVAITSEPSADPVAKPTEGPTKVAITLEPSTDPVAKPTEGPTKVAITLEPSTDPVAKPTGGPTKVAITSGPSADPVAKPTESRTKVATTLLPTPFLSPVPSLFLEPTQGSTMRPSFSFKSPTSVPYSTTPPSQTPTRHPSEKPPTTTSPSVFVRVGTIEPSLSATVAPTVTPWYFTTVYDILVASAALFGCTTSILLATLFRSRLGKWPPLGRVLSAAVSLTALGTEIIFATAASSSKQACRGCPDGTGFVILILSFLICLPVLAHRLNRLMLALDGGATLKNSLLYAPVVLLVAFDGDLLVWLPWRTTEATASLAGFPDFSSLSFSTWSIVLRKGPFIAFTAKVTFAQSASGTLVGVVTLVASAFSLGISLSTKLLRYLGYGALSTDVVIGKASDFNWSQNSCSSGVGISGSIDSPLLIGGNAGEDDGTIESSSRGAASAGSQGSKGAYVAALPHFSPSRSYAKSALLLLVSAGLAVLVVTRTIPSFNSIVSLEGFFLVGLGIALALLCLCAVAKPLWTAVLQCSSYEVLRASEFDALRTNLDAKDRDLEDQRQRDEFMRDVLRVQHGIEVDQLLPLAETQAKLAAAVAHYMQLSDTASVGGGGGAGSNDATETADDGKSPAVVTRGWNLQAEMRNAEAEVERWQAVLEAHPDRRQEAVQRMAAWRLAELPRCREALRFMRTVVPLHHRTSNAASVEGLVGLGLPLEVARRVSRSPALALVVTHPEDISRMHIADLRRCVGGGLSLWELRAVFAALPSVMLNDSKGEKKSWLDGWQASLEKMVQRETAESLSKAEAQCLCYRGIDCGPFDPSEPLKPTEAVRSTAFEAPLAQPRFASEGAALVLSEEESGGAIDSTRTGIATSSGGSVSRTNVSAMRDALALELSPKESETYNPLSSSSSSSTRSQAGSSEQTVGQRAAVDFLRTRHEAAGTERTGVDFAEANRFRSIISATAVAAAAVAAATTGSHKLPS